MTYVPVPQDQQKGTGRTPLEIPPALLAQLQHSRNTGARCRLDVTAEDDPADIDELRRAAIRCTYRHLAGFALKWEPDETGITFYVRKKRPAPAKKATTKRGRK